MPATALAEPERQQQAASMEAMLQAMMAQMSSVVGAVRDIGDRVGAIERRESISALEGAHEETKSGQLPGDSAAMAAEDSTEQLEPSPDQARRPAEDSAQQEGAGDDVTAGGSGTLVPSATAAAAATSSAAEIRGASAAEEAAANLVLAAAPTGEAAAEPPTPRAHLASASAGGKKPAGPSDEDSGEPPIPPVHPVSASADGKKPDGPSDEHSQDLAETAEAATEPEMADGLSANAAAGEERLGDTPAEPAHAALSPSQDGSGPAYVPSGSAGAEHGGSKEPSSRGLESLGGGEPPQKKKTRLRARG